MTNIWNSIFHNVFGVSYVRLPFMLSIPLIYKYSYDPFVDLMFMRYNEGNTQKAIWDRLEKKAAEAGANNDEDADAEVEAEVDA